MRAAALDFEGFYAAEKEHCLRAVAAATGDPDEAEDLTSEAFARAYARWDRVRAHPAPTAWVVRTAINLHRDRWRHRTRTRRLLRAVRQDTDQAPPPAPPLDPRLAQAVRALPPRQREVLAHRVLLGLSTEQTAQVLGVSAGTVKTHLHRALTTLRSSWQPDGADPLAPTLPGTADRPAHDTKVTT